MGKATNPTSMGRVFASVELEHVWKGTDAGIRLYMSLAGRDDPLVRSWRAPHGLPAVDQVDDLLAVVTDLLRTAVVDFVGVQEMLRT